MSPVQILIADDHELVRKGLISVLAESHPEWQVVGDAATGTAILDLSMPELGGLEVAKRLRESVPEIRILVLTMHAAAPIQRQLRKAGVNAYLAKNEAPKMLVQAVERVLAGEPFFASARTSRRTLEEPEYVPAQFLLTAREIDVLRLLARSKSNKELAADLGMSVRTAESHHAAIMAKLNVESLGDLVRIAVRDGIT
jgi:two-component system response regulator NreC